MVHDSIRNLRLDRRLLRRRGWISPEELERELAALPDVAEKGEIVAEDEGAGPPQGDDGAQDG
jgi:hypothetical protein